MFTTKIITKQDILETINQEDIIEKYLKIKPEFGKGFLNPLRPDTHPDCFFYIDKNDMIKFHDIPRGWNWDCFAIVSVMYNCNFYESIKIIAEDFNLKELDEDSKKIRRSINLSKYKSIKKTIKVKTRSWYKKDLEYWGQYDISKTILNFYNIMPLEEAYMDFNGEDKLIYKYRSLKELAYAYYLGNGNFKIYIPSRRKIDPYPRFYHNCPTHIQGYSQLPPSSNTLIITKSMKDVMSLFTFSVDSIANISESIIIRESIMNNLKQRFKNIYTLYDRDETGIRLTNKMQEMYNTKPLFFKEDEEKDWTDNLLKYDRNYMNKKLKLWLKQ